MKLSDADLLFDEMKNIFTQVSCSPPLGGVLIWLNRVEPAPAGPCQPGGRASPPTPSPPPPRNLGGQKTLHTDPYTEGFKLKHSKVSENFNAQICRSQGQVEFEMYPKKKLSDPWNQLGHNSQS